MKKKRPGSIRRKLIFSMLLIISVIFALVAIIVYWNMKALSANHLQMIRQRSEKMRTELKRNSEEQIAKIKKIYEDSLYHKGETLMAKDALKLKPLFLDNSITGIRSLLMEIFRLDKEIVSAGFFVNEGGEVKSWQMLTGQYPKGLGLKVNYDLKQKSWRALDEGNVDILVEDTAVAEILKNSELKIKLIDYKYVDENGSSRIIKAYDCSVPIFDGTAEEFDELLQEEEPIAYLRYILSLEAMQQMIAKEEHLSQAALRAQQQENNRLMNNTISLGESRLRFSVLIIIISAFIISILSYFLTRLVSIRLSQPILELSSFAQAMSQGDYSREVRVNSNDEVGFLGESFEAMRCQIKEFTENLQELVDGKTKEIVDILNNIDQGIFTMNLDLSINEQHSRKAEIIYETSQFHRSNLPQLFGSDKAVAEQFANWLEILRQPQKLKRWKKYSELSPVREIRRCINGQEHIIQIDYRPILEKGALSKLMVLSTDVTEECRAQAALERSKRQQQEQLEMVSCLLNCDAASLNPFLNSLREDLQFFTAVNLECAGAEALEELFRRMHTVKGSAGSFGLHTLANIAAAGEDLFEKMRNKGPEGKVPEVCWKNCLLELQQYTDSIQDLQQKIFSTESGFFSVDYRLYDYLLEQIKSGAIHREDQFLQSLQSLQLCTFATCCGKYESILNNYRQHTGKKINDLLIKTPQVLVNRELMSRFDTALVHLVRNALDHGLESNKLRTELGKGPGTVSLSLQLDEGRACLCIEDDGCGIDAGTTADKALEKGLVKKSELAGLTTQQKMELIFLPGFTTAEDVTQISGRGVGMDAVKASIEAQGGQVQLISVPGEGTRILLSLQT